MHLGFPRLRNCQHDATRYIRAEESSSCRTDFPLLDEVMPHQMLPWIPKMEVTSELWDVISEGKDSNASTSTYRPAVIVAMLVVIYLHRHQTPYNGVEDLLKEAKALSSKALKDINNNNARHFVPDVVRQLMLTSWLQKRVKVERGDTKYKGLLLFYERSNTKYRLSILVENRANGLPVVEITLSAKEWYEGYCGISCPSEMEPRWKQYLRHLITRIDSVRWYRGLLETKQSLASQRP
jgi:hypothetical protein